MTDLAVGDEARRRLPDKELTAEAKQALRTRRHMESLAENFSDIGIPNEADFGVLEGTVLHDLTCS